MNNLSVILYSGGSYGTYLHWVLDTLSCRDPIRDPHIKEGNSHGFTKGQLIGMEGWYQFLKEKKDAVQIVKLHPKRQKDESIVQNVRSIGKAATKILHLYPDPSSYLLVIHNYLLKISDDLWKGPLKDVNKDNIYNNWNIDPDSPLESIPTWIKREFFSHYLFDAWEAQVEWYLPDVLEETKDYRYFFVKDLLFDFDNTIQQIGHYLGIKFLRPINELHEHHRINLSRQKYLTQQSLAENIVHTTLNDMSLTWNSSDLTIYSEAWIQNRLRMQGFLMKCDGLDFFPTNSVNLKKILYRDEPF